MSKPLFVLCASLVASAAQGDVPSVVADIAPVHSLVSQVMQGLEQPELLLEPTASPHSYALRPSQAHSLQSADLVFTTSFELTPWLESPVENLAISGRTIVLMDSEENQHFEFRGEDHHDDHDDGDAHDEHDDHEAGESHDDHDDHDKEEAHDNHDDHDGGDAHGHDHAEGAMDPHGWLDPENAKVWLGLIAENLSKVDPENALIYMQNAQDAETRIDAMSAKIEVQMQDVKEKPYMSLHDAFQYFDRRFGPHFAGSISLGDAAAPSPARVANAQHELVENNVVCIFKEPQQNERLVSVVTEGTEVKLGTLDPLGAKLTPGPDLYYGVLQGLADSFSNCLKD